ncbi:hypothetical protein [Thermoactinospora rubra]|uniref:hypothetical protein n=1 Tax=Thermoactinospora rubra TaxID=1088767 RepID=UPI000A100064|nr:hypothetical protein [Thermoactinospora rubra]
MSRYSGPATLVTGAGVEIAVEVDLEEEPGAPSRWRGRAVTDDPAGLDPSDDVGNAVLRLPDGRAGRVVVAHVAFGRPVTIELAGGGPPPFG